MADIKKIKVGDVSYDLRDTGALHYTLSTVTVAGTSKSVATLTPSTVYVANGLIMGGTAKAAGLVTRGISGATPPGMAGSCDKDSLYINYDGDNNYSRKVVLGAEAVGTAIANAGGAYTYCAIRGDQMVAYTTNTCYTKTEVNNLLSSTLYYEEL